MIHVDVFVLRIDSPSLTGIQWFLKKFTLSLKQRKKEEMFFFFWKIIKWEFSRILSTCKHISSIPYQLEVVKDHIHVSKFVHCLTLLWLKTFWKRNTIKMCLFITSILANFKNNCMIFYNFLNDWNMDFSLKKHHDPGASKWT